MIINPYGFIGNLFKWAKSKEEPTPPDTVWVIQYDEFDKRYWRVLDGTEDEAITAAKRYARDMNAARNVILLSTSAVGSVKTYPPTFTKIVK